MVLPEGTFTPFPMHGYTKDISLGGLRFETSETTEEYYRLIIRKIRYARLTTCLPGTHQEVTLLGRVVWVQFNGKSNPSLCTYGLAFEEITPDEREAVRRCVDLIAQETAPGVSVETPTDTEIDVQVEVDPARQPRRPIRPTGGR